MIRGPVFPIITAFKNNGQVDYQSTLRYAEFLCGSGAKVLYLMAHSSRLNLLIPQEIEILNNSLASYIKGNYPNVVFIGATPPYGGIELALNSIKSAEQGGADYISVLFTERYYSDNQILTFFRCLSEKTNCKILIHGDKLNTIYGAKKENYPFHLLDSLFSMPNVAAMKEDTKEDWYTSEIVNRYNNDADIIVSGGSKEQFLQFNSQAYLVGIGSVWPKIALDFYEYYKSQNLQECWNIVEKYERPFFKITKRIGWHIALKASMEIADLMKRYERSPLIEVTNSEYQEIENLINSFLHYMK